VSRRGQGPLVRRERRLRGRRATARFCRHRRRRQSEALFPRSSRPFGHLQRRHGQRGDVQRCRNGGDQCLPQGRATSTRNARGSHARGAHRLYAVSAAARRQISKLHAGRSHEASRRGICRAFRLRSRGSCPLRRKSDTGFIAFSVTCVHAASRAAPFKNHPSRRRHMVRSLIVLALALLSQWAVAAVNLNTATKEELIALPGIGPAKAQAILDYRKANGAFKSVEELKDVKGIGAKRFEKLKPELTVAPAAVRAASASAKPAAAAAATKGEIRAAEAHVRK